MTNMADSRASWRVLEGEGFGVGALLPAVSVDGVLFAASVGRGRVLFAASVGIALSPPASVVVLHKSDFLAYFC
jgi:hypothetical protein